jgi:hypothetical protein
MSFLGVEYFYMHLWGVLCRLVPALQSQDHPIFLANLIKGLWPVGKRSRAVDVEAASCRFLPIDELHLSP